MPSLDFNWTAIAFCPTPWQGPRTGWSCRSTLCRRSSNNIFSKVRRIPTGRRKCARPLNSTGFNMVMERRMSCRAVSNLHTKPCSLSQLPFSRHLSAPCCRPSHPSAARHWKATRFNKAIFKSTSHCVSRKPKLTRLQDPSTPGPQPPDSRASRDPKAMFFAVEGATPLRAPRASAHRRTARIHVWLLS